MVDTAQHMNGTLGFSQKNKVCTCDTARCHGKAVVSHSNRCQIATSTFYPFFNLNYNIKHFEHDLWGLCTFTTRNIFH